VGGRRYKDKGKRLGEACIEDDVGYKLLYGGRGGGRRKQ
jgi:hypothetical protein